MQQSIVNWPIIAEDIKERHGMHEDCVIEEEEPDCLSVSESQTKAHQIEEEVKKERVEEQENHSLEAYFSKRKALACAGGMNADKNPFGNLSDKPKKANPSKALTTVRLQCLPFESMEGDDDHAKYAAAAKVVQGGNQP